jgi:hypothetical protein
MQPSNSPKGFSGVAPPRRGEAYAGVSILESRALSQGPPASSSATRAPAFART